jgi:hypothetical protein
VRPSVQILVLPQKKATEKMIYNNFRRAVTFWKRGEKRLYKEDLVQQ